MIRERCIPWYEFPQHKGKHLLLIEFKFEHRMPFIRALWRRMLWIERLDRLRIYRAFRFRYPVQGVHVDIGIRVTNLSNSKFPGGRISNFIIKHTGTELAIKTAGEHIIKALTMGESTSIWIANTTIDTPGPIWISCTVSSNEGVVQTFQCSRDKDNEVAISPVNHWSNDDFVLPHSDYLQARTNWLIVGLTIVTVVEAVFGLRNMLNSIVALIEESSQIVVKMLVSVFDLVLRMVS